MGQEERAMDVLALIVALIALAVAVAAYARTGGIQDLRHRVGELETDGLRQRGADALDRLSRLVRGGEKAAPGAAPSGGEPGRGEDRPPE